MNRTGSRRRLLKTILSEQEVTDQRQLARLMAEQGFRVTQATVSRDLQAVGAVKARSPGGTLRYIRGRPGTGSTDARGVLAENLASYARSVQASGNLVVVKTPPGAAQVVAAAIDGADLEGVLGTVAGDDTILIVATEASGGGTVAKELEQIGAGE